MTQEKNDINKIRIRSEEVQEILGESPRWIVRAGTSLIFIVVVVILIGSWFFKYPDIIQSKITITTQNLPVSLKAMSNGKITSILVKEKQQVQQNQIIAIIENPANYKDVLALESELDKLKDVDKLKDSTFLILGELQQIYSSFFKTLKSYRSYKNLDYFNEKIKSVKQQKSDLRLYYNRLWTQRLIKEQKLKLAEQQFVRDKSLFEKDVYSKVDYENSEKQYLQEKLSFESIRSTLANTQMQINQFDQQILDLHLQENQEQSQHELAIEEALQNLKGQIKIWKQKYLIISPIEGRVTFTKIWSEYQNVQMSEIVATIVPQKASNIIGKVVIPAIGVGKVKLGQTVNIKIDNFPYVEFGLLKGSVKSISLVPIITENEVFYTAEIEIPDTLISSYGKHLKFSQKMNGSAEIITEDVRLLQRFLNPLKSLWKNNIE